MNVFKSVFVVLLVIVVALAASSLFTVSERELAVKFRFGEIVESDYEPGLHFKVPIYNSVLKFDSRILTIPNPQEEFLTNEKKNLIVDFFVKWRITDPAQYYRATAGRETVAAQRLLEIIKDGIRGEIAKRTVQEVISAQRSELMDAMLVRAGQTASELGVSVVDVRIKRLDLPDQVSESVYERMRQERERIAKQLRAEGDEEAQRIRADADRERVVIRAEAYRRSEEIRGEGDAQSASIYAEAYNRNREFYAFHRSMEAYRRALGNGNDVLILGPDSDFFRYLNESSVQPPRQ